MCVEQLADKVMDFIANTGYNPIIGAEVEFYVIGDYCSDNSFLLDLENHFRHSSIVFEKEKGRGQFEAKLSSGNPVAIAEKIVSLREEIKSFCKIKGVEALFSPMPYDDRPGSAIHIHVSLLDNNGANPFVKVGDDESVVMKYAIAGLLRNMKENIEVFCPGEEGKKRLRQGLNSPKTISWGGNNRTVALRLPTTTTDPYNRRIEHRLPSSDSDPYLVIGAVLDGVMSGLVNKKLPQSEKIYGDAALEQYELELII